MTETLPIRTLVNVDEPPNPKTYEILIGSELDEEWSRWFDGFQVTGGKHLTVLRGAVADQSALHGLLARIRDLAMPLIEVRQVPPDWGELSNPDPAQREEQ